MRCTLVNEPADPHSWADNYLCVPTDSSFHFKWSVAGAPKDHSCIQWAEGADPHTWLDNYLCLERCTLTKIQVLNPDKYRPTFKGTEVIGVVSGGTCMGATQHYLTLESVDTVEESVGLEVSETNEINWEASGSVVVQASTEILGIGRSVALALETSVGGVKSWTTTETKVFTKGNSKVAAQSTYYNSPGSGIVLGVVDRYEFEQTNIPSKLHFTCPSGGSYIKDSTITLSATTYQAAHFEGMTGVFHKEACARNHGLPDCVRNLESKAKAFFVNMSEVREAFKQCFTEDKGYVGK